MRCQRCRGLLVRETFGDLREEAGCMCPATRCTNVDISRTPWFVPIASILLRQKDRHLAGWAGREESYS